MNYTVINLNNEGRSVALHTEDKYYHISGAFRINSAMLSDFLETNGEAFFLFNDVVPGRATPQPPPVSPAMAPVACPECGIYNVITNTFKCKVCGRDHLCKEHYSKDEKCCADCAAKVQAELTVEDCLARGR